MTFHDVVVNVQCGPGSHNVHCNTCPLGGLVGTSKAIGYPSWSRMLALRVVWLVLGGKIRVKNHLPGSCLGWSWCALPVLSLLFHELMMFSRLDWWKN